MCSCLRLKVSFQAESWYNVLLGLLPELRSAGENRDKASFL